MLWCGLVWPLTFVGLGNKKTALPLNGYPGAKLSPTVWSAGIIKRNFDGSRSVSSDVLATH
ncbi:MAG: hypothetical protein CM15mP83_5320 [Flavobacteriaceae bacterium]|nr:MAG: hypothetical protein CM15mP83_5320 [Flavobacteriaceae bacterium]